jgi:hypothetical protein
VRSRSLSVCPPLTLALALALFAFTVAGCGVDVLDPTPPGSVEAPQSVEVGQLNQGLLPKDVILTRSPEALTANLGPAKLGDRRFELTGATVLAIHEGGSLLVDRSTSLDAVLSRDFTVDLWVTPRDQVDQRVLQIGRLSVLIRGGRFVASAPGLAVTGSNVRSGAWQHLALEVSRDALSFYIDGVRFSGQATDGHLVGGDPGLPFMVGGEEGMTATPFIGLVDTLRLRTGQLYRGMFTPTRHPVTIVSAPVAFTFRRGDQGVTRLSNEGSLQLQASVLGRAQVYLLAP